MIVTHPHVNYEDYRGRITDILQNTPCDHATIVTSAAGSTRGNHYHKLSTQHVYLLTGKMLAEARYPGMPVEKKTLIPGDLVTNPPEERHSLTALQESVFLVLVQGPRGGDQFESDTYREDV